MSSASTSWATAPHQQERTFARTMRALDADGFLLSAAGLFVAVALLAAWLWWMFSARIPISETSGSLAAESPAQLALRAAGARNR